MSCWKRFAGGNIVVTATVLALSTLLAPIQLFAQKTYKVYPVEERMRDSKSAKRSHANVGKVFNGSVNMATGKPLLDAYYNGYVIPTLSDVDRGSLFGELRIELQKDLATARSSEARKYVLGKMYRECLKIADGDSFHPSARFNALLVLADLNETEGEKQVPPVPFNVVMQQLYKRYGAEQSPDIVKMGALVGLKRHLELRTLEVSPKPLSAAAKSALAAAFLPLLIMQEPPADRSPEGHDWMRRRAAELIGVLGQLGKDDAIPQALVDVMSDEKASLNLRAAAAAALGRIDLSQSKLVPETVAATYGKLAADCAKHEVEELKKLVTAVEGMGERQPRSFGESYTGMPVDEDEIVFADERTLPVRRRFLARMLQIRNGLAGKGRTIIGVQHKLPGASSVVPPVLTAIDEMLTVVKNPQAGVAELGISLREDYRALAKQVAGMVPAVEEPPAEQPPTPSPPAVPPVAPAADATARPAANIAEPATE